jgi:hypothetical protein
MNLLNRYYNEDKFRRIYEEALDAVDMNDAQGWVKHPCTQALAASIQGDICGILNLWLEGAYADENSVDCTAQREAKARGMSQAMDDILEAIQDIGNKKMIQEGSR